LCHGAGDLYLLGLSSDLQPVGEPKRVTFSKMYTAGPVWYPGGHSILFSSSGSFHNAALWRMPVPGLPPRVGEREWLSLAGRGAHQPAISRQGHLAYVRQVFDSDIWRLESTGSRRVDNAPLNSTSLDQVPQYSPDGKRIALTSSRSGDRDLGVQFRRLERRQADLVWRSLCSKPSLVAGRPPHRLQRPARRVQRNLTCQLRRRKAGASRCV
jgi:hypothetical protein